MMKMASTFFVLGCALLLTACDPGTGSPQDTIQSAAIALQNGKLADFNKTLTGDALAQYGNEAAFSGLRQNLANYSNIHAGDISLIDSHPGDRGDEVHVYKADIYGTPGGKSETLLYVAEVTCDVTESIYQAPPICTITPNQGQVCSTPAPQFTETQDCRIDELK